MVAAGVCIWPRARNNRVCGPKIGLTSCADDQWTPWSRDGVRVRVRVRDGVRVRVRVMLRVFIGTIRTNLSLDFGLRAAFGFRLGPFLSGSWQLSVLAEPCTRGSKISSCLGGRVLVSLGWVSG